MSDESPFSPPSTPLERMGLDRPPSVSIRAVLGLLISLYALILLCVAFWIAAVLVSKNWWRYQDRSWWAVAFLLAGGTPALVGGLRWARRKWAWPWLASAVVVHLLVVLVRTL